MSLRFASAEVAAVDGATAQSRDRPSSGAARSDAEPVASRSCAVAVLARKWRTDEAPVPYLRISGRWLEQYGLTRGSRVVVSGEPGKLVLTVADVADGRAAYTCNEHRPSKLFR